LIRWSSWKNEYPTENINSATLVERPERAITEFGSGQVCFRDAAHRGIKAVAI
jgi:hypothetical protein